MGAYYYHHAAAATKTHSASSTAYSQLLGSKRMRLAFITQHSEHPGAAEASRRMTKNFESSFLQLLSVSQPGPTQTLEGTWLWPQV